MVQGEDSHHLGRSPGKKAGNIPKGQDYWEGYQFGDLDTKEQDKDYAARTGV